MATVKMKPCHGDYKVKGGKSGMGGGMSMSGNSKPMKMSAPTGMAKKSKKKMSTY